MGMLQQKSTKQATASVKEPTSPSKNTHDRPTEELQHIIGNQALGHLIKSENSQDPRSDASPNVILRQISTANNSPIQRQPLFRGLSHELKANRNGNLVQAKLTVNQPGDKYELEADRVAEQVVKQINAPASDASDRLVQGEAIQTKKLMRKSVSSPGIVAGGMAATPDLETSIKRKQGKGQPISQDIREPIEQSLNHDLSGVRVHADDQSDKLNRSLQSVAFTRGQDIFFKQGTYQPRNREGQKLLIHELTHVVQQGSQQQILQRKGKEEPKKKPEEHPRKIDILQDVSKEVGGVADKGAKIGKAAGASDAATSTATSAGEMISSIGNFRETLYNKDKDTVDKFFAGGKMAAEQVKSGASITSQNLNSGSTEAGIADAVSEVAGGVSNLWDVFAEAKGLLNQITSDKGISKTKIGKAAADTLTKMGKTGKAGASAASKIQTLIGDKDKAKVSSNVSSIIGDSVTLFESAAKGIQEFATFIKDYQAGKFDAGDVQSYRIIELIFQSVNTLQTLTSGALGLGKTIAGIVSNDVAKAALGLGADIMGIVTGSIQVLQNGYKISRASVKKSKLDILAGGRSEEEQKALMLIKDRLTKQQANAGINMVLGAAGIVSGSLAVSGVGALPGAIIAGIAAGFKISRVGFKKFKQYMRDRAQGEYDEAVTILTEVAKTASANQEKRKKTGQGAFLGMESADYYSGISQKMNSVKYKGTKKILESVLDDIQAEKGLLLTEEQITLYMGQREYGKTIDILKQVASQVPANAKKALGEDVQAYRKALKEQIEMSQGKTKDRLKQVLEYIDKDNPLPLQEMEILKVIEDAEVSRIGESNLIMRQFIFSRLKSTKQKEAMYYMSAEQILKMDIDEVYTILNLSRSEIEAAAEKAKKDAEKKYSDEEYKDLDEVEKQSSIQGEVAEAVKKLVIKQLKDIK